MGAVASDTVYQLLAHGWWFSPGIPASATTKAGRHDIDEILLEVALSTMNQIESINHCIALHIVQKQQHHQHMINCSLRVEKKPRIHIK